MKQKPDEIMDHLGSSKCPIDDNKFASVNPVQLENRLQRIHADADWKTFHRFLLGSRLRSQTIAPLGEELAFRHFLLNLFPFRKPLWAGVAIVVTALAFASIHLQYTFKSTVVLLFVLALMLAYARVKTGGLLVPMAMHACASLLALVLYPVFYA